MIAHNVKYKFLKKICITIYSTIRRPFSVENVNSRENIFSSKTIFIFIKNFVLPVWTLEPSLSAETKLSRSILDPEMIQLDPSMI
jgi:hypothetical protein